MTVVSDKMFHVLDTISASGSDVVSLAQLTAKTKIPKATLYRLLCDLSGAGMLEHVSGGYSLGTRLFELGHSVPKYRHIRRSALPQLEQLNQQTSETVHLAVMRQNRLIMLEKLHGHYAVRIPTATGGRLPLHSTALGKVVLAFGPAELAERVFASSLRPVTRRTIMSSGHLEKQVDEAFAEGFAIEYEETVLGIGCTARPIFDGDGAFVGAVSVSGNPATRRAPALLKRLEQTADAISMQYEQRLVAA